MWKTESVNYIDKCCYSYTYSDIQILFAHEHYHAVGENSISLVAGVEVRNGVHERVIWA